ncbi:uncharacterized protein VDAG_04055 [Verticillium dahliae VdLs.17]|uniref:HTH CENPB-type domain-containing protein n=1 Tax=Verticillium dahliae (strain VdLs.17 / ATCC MYA-4575 / FGSC 10137) TaxID=498257 RepID=G2X1C6_VERDV|nr:uncharacterized protein VDAG_04055 [Verticillium dahliae VdLs.17]EGY22617.1 hypothetical protein VDAG_04055 [Verticillium dahliae VdLs.17]
MKRYTEEDVSNALQAIIDGCSTRKASRDWNIPATTLRGRLKGATTIREAKAPYQRLSQAQEQHLARWIIEQGALGFAPSHSQVLDFARRILLAQGDDIPLGRHWIEGFKQRSLYYDPPRQANRSQPH